MKEAVDDIMVTLNEAASEGGMVGGMVESIAESMGRVSKSVFVCEMSTQVIEMDFNILPYILLHMLFVWRQNELYLLE